MDVDRVLLAEPRGFCAGVQMAIKALSWMVRVCEPPVYCNHEIVHNQSVVEHFKNKGVRFVDSITDVPNGSAVMLSAHGSAPEVVAYAKAHAGATINAVCPLVTKVHHEMKVRSGKGYTVIYVGHAGHQEAIGTMAVAPHAVRMVESAEDVHALDDLTGDVALLAQTTLSHDDWSEVLVAAKDRFPNLWMPNRSDLCYATTNRQAALRKVAQDADAVIVVGSANSSNTVALTKVAKNMGVKRVLRVNAANEIPDDLTGVIAVTAGASAPDKAVQAVIERLAPSHGVQVVRSVEEEEYFPPPRELREMLDAFGIAVAFGLGAPSPDQNALDGDREIHASNVLDDEQG